MDLRHYFQSIRDMEAQITDEFPIIASKPTPEGGSASALTEVSREIAARMIVEERARLATAEEIAAFRERQAEERRNEEEMQMRRQLSAAVLSESALEALRNLSKRGKS